MKLVSPQELALASTAPTMVTLLLRQAGWKYFGGDVPMVGAAARDTWYPPLSFPSQHRKLMHSLEAAWKLHLHYAP